MLLSIKVFYRICVSYKNGACVKEEICLNTTQVECFIEVANSLNFSRAAESLRLSQPAVSHQISALEDELSVRLTQAGYLFTQYAGEMLRLFNVSKDRLRAASEEQQRVLGIGCRNTLELRLLATALAELRLEEPGFVPAFRVVPHDSLENLPRERAEARGVPRALARAGGLCGSGLE